MALHLFAIVSLLVTVGLLIFLLRREYEDQPPLPFIMFILLLLNGAIAIISVETVSIIPRNSVIGWICVIVLTIFLEAGEFYLLKKPGTQAPLAERLIMLEEEKNDK